MNYGAPNQADCYPSETPNVTLKFSATADRMKRFSYSAPARTR